MEYQQLNPPNCGSWVRKAADGTGLQHDGKSQDLAGAGNRQKMTILVLERRPLFNS